MHKKEVKLKNGQTVIGDAFDQNDLIELKKIFQNCRDINKKLKALEGRALNVPDVFSEALYCIYFDAVRTNNKASSYDCVCCKTGEGIQVKSASIKNDCSSFGPTSKWDRLYFIDFAPNGKVDGIVDFYEIKEDIYSIVLNTSKNETFKMQQEQGRRPRFSIKSKIIKEKNLKPIKTISLVD